MKKVAVIGAGLAGSECAWILAEYYEIQVILFEMKSKKMTPAQISPHLFCELVCSNSLKSTSLLNPAGSLKNEMVDLGSLVIPAAKQSQVPAGESLSVDREKFSQIITDKLKSHKNIKIVEDVVTSIDAIFAHDNFDSVVIATGPLTDDQLSMDLKNLTRSDDLYFYDAIAPIIDGDSIDRSQVFKANRESRTASFERRRKNKAAAEINSNPEQTESNLNDNKTIISAESNSNTDEETGDYLNIPLNKEEYESFVHKLNAGPKVPHHDFEEPKYFNGCQPIEVLAERGMKTLAFGPMKPKGLTNPKTGRMPYAAIQLRKEKQGDEAWNMVGFQTRLTWGAQKEIFKTLPGLAQAEFFRMGSMHRNTYMVAPNILNQDFSFKENNKLYLAGQIMGVEGYLESAAMGLFIGHMIGQKLVLNKTLELPPADTSLGALCHYCLFTEAKKYTPMNIHWGLFSALTDSDMDQFCDEKNINTKKIDKSIKRFTLSKRSTYLFKSWLKTNFTPSATMNKDSSDTAVLFV